MKTLGKRMLKRTLRRADRLAARLGASNRVLASLYYLFRGSFSREHQAVLAGRLAYSRSLQDPTVNTSLLRRNIHRIEKGLLMRPRRVPFGLNYIGETVAAYELAVRHQVEALELAWARDVLHEYMRITPSHPVVDPLREMVVSLDSIPRDASQPPQLIPYARSVDEAPNINYEQLLRLAKYRRSVRWYLPQPVPREAIERAVEVAALSPTACNRLPYEFRVIDEPSLVQQVIQLPMGTSGFNHQVPGLAVIVGKLRNYPNERDRHLIYVDGALAAMSFVYALEAQGIGSCCINWPDIEERETRMARLLKLAPDERPIMLVSFGYPDPEGLVARSTKKSLTTICKFNFESK